MGINHPGGIIKNLVAIIMAGVLGIYGLIVAIIIAGGVSNPKDMGNTYSQYTGWAHLSAGLCCGFCCLAAGYATGIAGEYGIKATGLRAELNHARNNKMMAGMSGGGKGEITDEGDAGKLYIASVTILSFSGAIGLYGFIVALIICSSGVVACDG